jgi:hypothetical protein
VSWVHALSTTRRPTQPRQNNIYNLLCSAPDLAVIDTVRSNRPSPHLSELLQMVREGAFPSPDRDMTHGLGTENFVGGEEVGLQ